MYVCMYVCLLDGWRTLWQWTDRDSLAVDGWSTLTKLSVSVWCCVVFIVLYCTIYSGVVGKVLVIVVLWWWFYGGFVLWWFYLVGRGGSSCLFCLSSSCWFVLLVV